MDHNSDQSESIKDELVFFGGIINQLLQSKKIIIVTTLVFTISLFFYTDTKLVNEIESTAINLNLKTYAVFQGLILGFIISIFFVLINNFIKTYRRT